MLNGSDRGCCREPRPVIDNSEGEGARGLKVEEQSVLKKDWRRLPVIVVREQGARAGETLGAQRVRKSAQKVCVASLKMARLP